MKTHTTSETQSNFEKKPIPPALTRALRQAIQADKLGSVFLAAGATKLRGTPIEVLEEVAALQTAAWIVGYQNGPMTGPVPNIAEDEAEPLGIAVETIDAEAVGIAAAVVGIRGTNEVANIRRYLASNLAATAVEATRFAASEERPVCHNCVAIGASSVARSTLQASFASSQPISINR